MLFLLMCFKIMMIDLKVFCAFEVFDYLSIVLQSDYCLNTSTAVVSFLKE